MSILAEISAFPTTVARGGLSQDAIPSHTSAIGSTDLLRFIDYDCWHGQCIIERRRRHER
jgi:hypothetical protein